MNEPTRFSVGAQESLERIYLRGEHIIGGDGEDIDGVIQRRCRHPLQFIHIHLRRQADAQSVDTAIGQRLGLLYGFRLAVGGGVKEDDGQSYGTTSSDCSSEREDSWKLEFRCSDITSA